MKHRIIRLWRGMVIILLLMVSLFGYGFSTAAPMRATSYLTPNNSIQSALDNAQPGDTLVLGPGIYAQDLLTVRDGLPGAPITISGPRDAILSGQGDGRLVEINHSYIVLDGFTINGAQGSSHSDKLIYVINKRAGVPLLGLKITNMAIGQAGDECIRLRYMVQQAEIAGNTIGPCGIDYFPNGVWAGGSKNGEGVYIGTAPEQRADGKNPDSRPDESNSNWVHHNTFNTQGNECVDIKESASNNLVEYNDCTGQRDPDSAGLDARGSGNIFRWNRSYNNLGSGVRLGGDTTSDGIANQVYENELFGNSAGIKIQRDQQARICGNTGAQGNLTSGTFGSRYQAGMPCSSSTASSPTTIVLPLTVVPATVMPATVAVPATAVLAAPSPTLATANSSALQLRAGQRMIVQAEQGRLSEQWQRVDDSNRQGGAYIRNSGPGGVRSVNMPVSYAFDKLDGGRSCKLQVFGRGDGDDANSVRVRIDDRAWVVVHVAVRSWRWADAEDTLSISNGPHQLQIGNRESGTSVDAWSLLCE